MRTGAGLFTGKRSVARFGALARRAEVGGLARRRNAIHAELVNFVSHAAVASWYDASPAFVLGAMLPDFFGMLALRPAPLRAEGPLARGIAFHHLSDAAFHDAPAFLALTRDARKALMDAGVRKGPARAVAHIGVELLLDPALLADAGARAAYTAALDAAPRLGHELGFDRTDEQRLIDLAGVIRARGISADAQSPDTLVARIRRALSDRPRLALDDEAEDAVRNWVVATQASIVGCASDVVRQVLSQLDGRGFGHAKRGVSFS
ncbi:MAG: hypothetical protein ACOY0T_13785 [Myxococcota bacterium]